MRKRFSIFRSTILIEWHTVKCTCSYCNSSYDHKKLHYGLNIPKHWWGWNSWYVIKFLPRFYFRWTNAWLKHVSK